MTVPEERVKDIEARFIIEAMYAERDLPPLWSEKDWREKAPPRYVDSWRGTFPQDEAFGWTDRVLTGMRRTGMYGENLMLSGPLGSERSALAWALIRRLWKAHIVVMPTTALEVRDALHWKASDDQKQAVRKMRDIDVLFVDGVGSHRPDSHWEEQFMALLNHRFDQGLPVLTTTKFDEAELERVLGEEIADRLTSDTLLVTLQAEPKAA